MFCHLMNLATNNMKTYAELVCLPTWHALEYKARLWTCLKRAYKTNVTQLAKFPACTRKMGDAERGQILHQAHACEFEDQCYIKI